jgi:hypothetical protein
VLLPLVLAAAGVTETVPEAALVPTELVAVTEQLYVVPLVRLETVIGLAVPVPVLEVLLAVQVAVYPVMVAPPFELGAVNAMLALPSPAVAAPMVGAPGTLLLLEPLPQAASMRLARIGTSAWAAGRGARVGRMRILGEMGKAG